MISHEYKCIFIHIPKCAGTSIERAFRYLEGRSDPVGNDHRTIRMIEPLAILPALGSYENERELIRRALHKVRKKRSPDANSRVTRQQYLDYFKFTIVRDPWTRAHSWYMNVMRSKNKHRRFHIHASMSLSDFLLENAGKHALRPQTDWISDWRGDIPLDFIGQFQNLDEDFKTILSKLGCEQVALPGKAEALNRSITLNITDEVNALIAKVYKREIDYFGFSPPNV